MGAMGLLFGDLLRSDKARAAQVPAAKLPAEKGPRAKSILHIFLPGGMAQQESFDPKPYAPLEYRGSFGAVKTKLPGELFSEMWPETAGVADKLCIVRSMSHGEAAHERGTHNMFTGYRPSPAIQYPSLGSIVGHELGSRADLPAYVCVPNQPNPYAGTGYLNSSYGPFSLGADPGQGGFRVRDLALPDGVDAWRFTRRRTAMDAVNAHFEAVEKADAIGAMDTFYQQAYSLISSPKAREAFNLDAEPPAIRDEYGRNVAGSRLLMCRRLIAAGVRVVSVTYGGWDFHRDIVPATRQEVPPLDRAFAALIRDLDRTGLLGEHDRHALQRIRPDAEDQRRPRPGPLAAGFQHPAGRRRHRTGQGFRRLDGDGGRARLRGDWSRRPVCHALPLAGHRLHEAAAGARRQADRHRSRRPVATRVVGMTYVMHDLGRLGTRASSSTEP